MNTKTFMSFFLSGVGSTAVLIATAAPAWAQEAPAEQAVQNGESAAAGEIMVTARKRNERLQDVPETITALSADALKKSGIRNVDDLGRRLPNVVLNRRGDSEPNVVIRGVGSFGNTQGVGFYIDDVRNVTDQTARLVDLERVEVLKGPQGTLYGGSSIGGAVKFVTKKPTYNTEGQVTAEAGQRNILNVSGSVNLPIVDGVAALRFSAYADHDGGYLYNPYLNEHPDESLEYGLRATLRLNPDDATEIIANARYSKLENGNNDYHIVSGPDEYSFLTPLSAHVYNHRQILGGTVSITRDLDFATLTSLTSYTQKKNRGLQDVDYTPADDVGASQRKPVVTKVFTQELRLASDGSGPFNWLLGAYYSSVKNRDVITQVDLYLGVPIRGAPTIPDFYNTPVIERNYAGFANIGYKSGPFEINIGARLDHYSFKATDFTVGRSGQTSDTIVLPKLSLAYHASRELLAYASVSKGYEPGKLNTHGDNTLVPFKRETSVNAELGIKGQAFGGFLDYDLAAFYIRYKNRQLETRVNDNGVIVDIVSNIGTSESHGLEFSGTLHPTSELSISGTGGLLKAKALNGTFDLQDISGKTITDAPRFTGGISADYTKPISDYLKIGLRGELNHNSGFFWDVPNLTRQKAYNIATFRVSLAEIDDKWELALRVDNAFNKLYNYEYQDHVITDRDANGVCNQCADARIGAPRTIKGSFSYKF